MAKIKGTIIVDIERCKGCGVCVPSCPNNVLALSPHVNGKGYNYSYMANPDDCIGCAKLRYHVPGQRHYSLQTKNSSKR